MPKRPMTPEQQDALEDAIVRQLYRINKVVRGMFGTELSDQELLRSHDRIQHGVDQAMQQPPPQPTRAPAPPARLPISEMAEGGFINDSSRMQTDIERQRLGIR